MSAALAPRLRDFAALVKLSHSVFALPFALLSLLTATAGAPPLPLWLPCVLAVVAARTAAMAWNRYVDRDLDAANPRTRGREIPRGAVSPRAALGLTAAAGGVFVLACSLLGPRCTWLSVPTLLWLCAYSLVKRFSALCHLWLGAALGLAPIGCWVAAADVLAATGGAPAVPWTTPLWLAGGVVAWVAGFDILYACQDEAFDRAHGLHSIPARLGARRALWLSRLLHAAAAILFAGFGAAADLGAGYFAGVVAATAVLWWQQHALRPAAVGDLKPGFFLANGILAVAMLAGGAYDVYSGG